MVRGGVQILIERLEAGGEDAINAGTDEALPTRADDTPDAIETVDSLRDELEHEQRQGDHDAEPDDDHAHPCETAHSSAPPLDLSASALPKWSPGGIPRISVIAPSRSEDGNEEPNRCACGHGSVCVWTQIDLV